MTVSGYVSYCTHSVTFNRMIKFCTIILQFSPVFSESSAQYVHHSVVYICSDLDHTHVGASSECADSHIDISLCRGSTGLIGVWAVGGNVSVVL